MKARSLNTYGFARDSVNHGIRKLENHDYMILAYVSQLVGASGEAAVVAPARLAPFVGLDVYSTTVRIIHLIHDRILICKHRDPRAYYLDIAALAPATPARRAGVPGAA